MTDRDHGADHHLDTRTIHAAAEPDAATGAVAPPVYQTSTFAFRDCDQGAHRFDGSEEGYIYTRLGNPTLDRLERAIADLEGGAGAIATGSGMAALCTTLFGMLNQGDHMVGTSSVYGPSRGVVERHFSRFGVESTFVDTSDLDAVRTAFRPNTRLVFIETPANPTVVLTDIAAVARLAHEHGALLLVDNTFASPILQRPLEHGADLVMHSITKFLNGHTDVVGGVVIVRDREQLARLRTAHHALGACMDPHQAWLVLRGLRTLSMRVRAAQANARRLAEWLEGHEAIEWVRYPGLASHPQHALAVHQMDGPGALMSFEVRGGVDAGRTVLDNVRLLTLAVSLGGIETLIQHPSSMTHAGMPREQRLAAGITDGLVRMSVGCEAFEDLQADLAQALAKVAVASPAAG